MRYLLDTNILSDLIRNPQGRVMQHIQAVGESAVCTSIIVTSELRYGAVRRARLASPLSLKLSSDRLKFCPSSHPLMSPTGSCEITLNGLDNQLVETICFIAAQAIRTRLYHCYR